MVTGAGRGVGAAVARLLAQHGARLVINDLDEEPAQETGQAIVEAGGEALVVVEDLTAAGAAERLVAAALDQWGSLDVLVNNAGYTWDGAIHRMSDEQWEAMLAIHLTAPFRLLRAAGPFLRERAKAEGGATARKIINISSVSAMRGNAGQTNYAAGKAGIVGVTRSLAKEWGQFNIQVNAAAFGMIETRLTDSWEAEHTTVRGDEEIALGMPDSMRELALMVIPMGRAGTVEEAAGPVLFFASPLSDYVSGQVLEVTGGF